MHPTLLHDAGGGLGGTQHPNNLPGWQTKSYYILGNSCTPLLGPTLEGWPDLAGKH